MVRSYSSDLFREALIPYPECLPAEWDYDRWLADENNIMFVDDGSIGLLSYEYPGVYNGHWFFKVRGKKALSLAREMLSEVFEKYDAKAIRGLTPEANLPARWLAKQLGFISMGFVTYPDEDAPHELMVLTVGDFNQNRTQ